MFRQVSCKKREHLAISGRKFDVAPRVISISPHHASRADLLVDQVLSQLDVGIRLLHAFSSIHLGKLWRYQDKKIQKQGFHSDVQSPAWLKSRGYGSASRATA